MSLSGRINSRRRRTRKGNDWRRSHSPHTPTTEEDEEDEEEGAAANTQTPRLRHRPLHIYVGANFNGEPLISQ
jgi:hypothetical protein